MRQLMFELAELLVKCYAESRCDLRDKRSLSEGDDALAKVDCGNQVFRHQTLQVGALWKKLDEFFLDLGRPPDSHPEIGHFVKEAQIPGGNLDGGQQSI